MNKWLITQGAHAVQMVLKKPQAAAVKESASQSVNEREARSLTQRINK